MIEKIDQTRLDKIKAKTPESLPINPSTSGMSPQAVRRHFYAGMTDENESVVAELNRIVEETNTELALKADTADTYSKADVYTKAETASKATEIVQGVVSGYTEKAEFESNVSRLDERIDGTVTVNDTQTGNIETNRLDIEKVERAIMQLQQGVLPRVLRNPSEKIRSVSPHNLETVDTYAEITANYTGVVDFGESATVAERTLKNRLTNYIKNKFDNRVPNNTDAIITYDIKEPDKDSTYTYFYWEDKDAGGNVIGGEWKLFDLGQFLDHISQQVPEFTIASVRANINSGENLATILGKVEKVIADLKTHAFSDDIKDTVTTFTEASTRANIATGESTATLFGKIKKYFTDLKTHAFNDLATVQGTETDKAPTNKLLSDELAAIPRQIITVNSNFALNTNGLTSYTGDGTSACNGWTIAGGNSTLAMLTKGIRLTAINNATNRAMRQFMTRYALWGGVTITFAIKVVAITGNGAISINDGVSSTTTYFSATGTHVVTRTINASPTNLFFQIGTGNIANSSIDIEYAYAIQGSYLPAFQPEQLGLEYAKNQLYLNTDNISTVMPISSAAASNTKVLGEKVVYNEFALKAPLANPTFTGTVIVPITPSGPSAAVSKSYADGLSTPYDKVIRTQTEFEDMITDGRTLTNENIQSSTWKGAKSVALVGQFTLSTTDNSGIKIPDTVKQIHGFNSAKITVTNFVHNLSTAKGGLWYDTLPTTNDYSIRDLEVDCTGANDYGYGFYNCTNLTNCTGTATGTGTNGYGFSSCTNLTNCTGKATGTGTYGRAYGFYNCTNLTNCTGTATSTETNGYGFYNITTASNCKDAGSTTAMWGGENRNIDIETCRKTPVTANNTTLNT